MIVPLPHYDLGHKTAKVQVEHVGADSVKKITAACPVLGLEPAGLWVSRPPVLGLVALAGGARLF